MYSACTLAVAFERKAFSAHTSRAHLRFRHQHHLISRRNFQRCSCNVSRRFLATASPRKTFFPGDANFDRTASATRIWACGSNERGQLGTSGRSEYYPTPITSLDGQKVVLIGCGALHTVAFTEDGRMLTWGFGKFGQHGHENEGDNVLVPTELKTDGIFKENWPVKIMGSGVTTTILTENGQVYIFGNTERFDGVSQKILPFKPLEKYHIVDIAGEGWGHVLALTRAGEVLSFGWNQQGQLGLGNYEPQRQPQVIRGLSGKDVQSVSAGQDTSFAVTSSGDVYAWGDNSNGQLALGDQEGTKVKTLPQPKLIPNLKAKNVVAGIGHVLARASNGAGVYSWGWNSEGQLGLGESKANFHSPKLIAALEGENVIRVAAGRVHSAALLGSGEVALWGSGVSGRLGFGDNRSRHLPELNFEMEKQRVVDVILGYDHSIFVTKKEAPK